MSTAFFDRPHTSHLTGANLDVISEKIFFVFDCRKNKFSDLPTEKQKLANFSSLSSENVNKRYTIFSFQFAEIIAKNSRVAASFAEKLLWNIQDYKIK